MVIASILHAIAGAVAGALVKSLIAQGWAGRLWAWLRPANGRAEDACVTLIVSWSNPSPTRFP
jgi:hypothetical protein